MAIPGCPRFAATAPAGLYYRWVGLELPPPQLEVLGPSPVLVMGRALGLLLEMGLLALELLQRLVGIGEFLVRLSWRTRLAPLKAPATALPAIGGVARFDATAVQLRVVVLATATAANGRCFWQVQAADRETGATRP